ncbi:DUF6270 domain-containing protein [Methanobacterium sp.]|uniref:DUF6270 domain-containing protein n=1 Tax=Methanobacterium sp. TaxID=2164 RepID=UPI003C709EF3
MSFINVGVIGACVSRDNFNSLFNSGHNRLFNCKLYIGHITFPSLVSEKIDFNEEDIDHKDPLEVGAIKRELSRSFIKELQKASDLDYLIIDFYSDIYYGIVIADDMIFTDNYDRVSKTKFYSNLENKKFLTLLNNPDEYFEIWKESFHNFVEMIETIMPNVKIIINKARAMKEYKDQQGNIRCISMSRDPDEVNEKWDKLDDYCIKTFGFQYIDLSAKDYFSHENYPFGGPPRAVHYTKDFYENFIMELSSIVVQDLQENLYKFAYPEFYMNQVDNSNFEIGKASWSFWQKKFHILNDKVEINNRGIKEEKCHLILSNPIKVKKGEIYNLSFKVYIDRNVEFDSDIIFYLMIFNKSANNSQEDSVWYNKLEYANYTNGKVRNEWITVKYIFTVQNNGFLKVGPSINKNGHVKWKDIYLTKELGDDLSWSPSYRDIMSNINLEKIQELSLGIQESHDKRKEMETLFKLNEYKNKLDKYESTIIEYENKIDKYESRIKEYKNSTSWKMTLPLRKTGYIVKNLRKLISS